MKFQEWDKILKDEIVKELKNKQNRLILNGNNVYKLAKLNEDTLKFEISEGGNLLNLGVPFKDRYPLNYRRVVEWSSLLSLNGGAVYGGLLYRGSKRSKNWINRFVLAMGE